MLSLTSVTELPPLLVTQMSVPSKAIPIGALNPYEPPRFVSVWTSAPVLVLSSVTVLFP